MHRWGWWLLPAPISKCAESVHNCVVVPTAHLDSLRLHHFAPRFFSRKLPSFYSRVYSLLHPLWLWNNVPCLQCSMQQMMSSMSESFLMCCGAAHSSHLITVPRGPPSCLSHKSVLLLAGLTICGVDCLLSAEWKSPNKIIARTGQAKGTGDIIVITHSGGIGSTTVQFRGYNIQIGNIIYVTKR